MFRIKRSLREVSEQLYNNVQVHKIYIECGCGLFRYIFRNAQKVGLQELGPRITLKLRSLQRGTFDSKYGEYIWLHKVSGLQVVMEIYTLIFLEWFLPILLYFFLYIEFLSTEPF